MPKRYLGKVGLARTGGKQAILKRADHRFIQRFVSHNGCTSFPEAQLRALRDYHEYAERCKSFLRSLVERFFSAVHCLDRLTWLIPFVQLLGLLLNRELESCFWLGRSRVNHGAGGAAIRMGDRGKLANA
jgi:hypothetical protein